MASKKKIEEDNLFQSIGFWSDTIKVVDNRIRLIAETQKFGEIGISFIIRHGRVVDVVFSEEVRIRQSDDKKIQKDAG